MLNWDEYGKEENTTPSAAATTEAVKVMAEPQEKQPEPVVMDTAATETCLLYTSPSPRDS